MDTHDPSLRSREESLNHEDASPDSPSNVSSGVKRLLLHWTGAFGLAALSAIAATHAKNAFSPDRNTEGVHEMLRGTVALDLDAPLTRENLFREWGVQITDTSLVFHERDAEGNFLRKDGVSLADAARVHCSIGDDGLLHVVMHGKEFPKGMDASTDNPVNPVWETETHFVVDEGLLPKRTDTTRVAASSPEDPSTHNIALPVGDDVLSVSSPVISQVMDQKSRALSIRYTIPAITTLDPREDLIVRQLIEHCHMHPVCNPYEERPSLISLKDALLVSSVDPEEGMTVTFVLKQDQQ